MKLHLLHSLRSLRKVVSEVAAAGMRDLKSEMKKELSQVRTSFGEDMRVQLDELTAEVGRQVGAATGRIEEVAERLGEVEKSMVVKEKWDGGVKDTSCFHIWTYIRLLFYPYIRTSVYSTHVSYM